MRAAHRRLPRLRAPGRLSAVCALAAVFVGGAAGALARVGLTEAWPVAAGEWPWATFVVNLAGCLTLGAVLVLTADGSARRGLLGPGLCGGLTTFSTLQVELVLLIRDGAPALAATYATVSVVAGLSAVEVGRRLAGGLPPARPQRAPDT